MTMTAQMGYARLDYPTEPQNWRFCGMCGRAMSWVLTETATFIRATGEPYRSWQWQCAGYDGTMTHDMVPNGRPVADDLL